MQNEIKSSDPGLARVMVSDAEYERLEPALARVIEELDLAGWYAALRNKTVFVKPNMLGLFPPLRAATTHPTLVRGLVRLFRAAGAKVIVGDNCGVGNYGINQRAAKVTGLAEASEEAYVNVAQDTRLAAMKSRFLDSIVVSRAMLEADFLVSVPKMKTHSLTLVTGAVKNSFGLVSGAGKSLAHNSAPSNKDFGEMLADIFALRPPDLVVMDAVMGMEGNGPSGGKPKAVGKLLASTNAVALDAVMCRIMGLEPSEVHHLRVAARRGLGPLGPEAIEVVGALPRIKKFKLPVTIHKLSFIGRFVNQRFYAPLLKTKLVLDRGKCQQCKLCVEGCPTKAMQWDDRPWIKEDVCIHCLCCHELCPESAWELEGFLGRWMTGRGKS